MCSICRRREKERKAKEYTKYTFDQFQIGDKVIVNDVVNKDQKEWSAWNDDPMDEYLGKEAVIVNSDEDDGTFALERNSDWYWFHYSTFRPVEEKAKFKIGMKIRIKSKLTDEEKAKSSWFKSMDVFQGKVFKITDVYHSRNSVQIDGSSCGEKTSGTWSIHEDCFEIYEEPKLEVGTKIQVYKELTKEQKDSSAWNYDMMDALMGNVYEVSRVYSEDRVQIRALGSTWSLRSTCFEIYEETEEPKEEQESFFDKLKSGDKVRIKAELTEEQKSDSDWDPIMDKYIGKEVVITRIVDHESLRAKNDSLGGGSWYFHKSCLEPYVEEDPSKFKEALELTKETLNLRYY
jgi:ribosomal protein L19